MNILYDTIHKIAESTYRNEVTVETYDAWIAHWINTAFAMRDKCESEGLTNTVFELDKIIRQQTAIGFD